MKYDVENLPFHIESKLSHAVAIGKSIESTAIANVLEYIDNNYSNKIKVKELASLTHYGTGHLRRVFYQILKLSAREYLSLLRINKACKLLVNSDCKVLDVALQLGYFDQSHFHHAFKKHIGITPREYRIHERFN